MIEEILELFEYNRWANRRVLAAVARLSTEEYTRDMGNSFPSVRDTLAHILGTEWIWLSRWQGTSPTGLPESWELSTLESLQARWDEVEREQMEFLAGLTDDALRAVISYRNVEGKENSAPLWQLLRHMVNHSTYHRGQIATLLRQLGAEPVGTDMVRFYRERVLGVNA